MKEVAEYDSDLRRGLIEQVIEADMILCCVSPAMLSSQECCEHYMLAAHWKKPIVMAEIASVTGLFHTKCSPQ